MVVSTRGAGCYSPGLLRDPLLVVSAGLLVRVSRCFSVCLADESLLFCSFGGGKIIIMAPSHSYR